MSILTPFKILAIVAVVGVVLAVKYLFFGGLGELLFVTSNSDLYCTDDGDCVAEPVCHPTRAVNRKAASEYESPICTLECRPNTLDCGQGEIKCINDKCTAIIGE